MSKLDEFVVTVKETRYKDIIIEAEDEFDALDLVRDLYNDGKISMDDPDVEIDTAFEGDSCVIF